MPEPLFPKIFAMPLLQEAFQRVEENHGCRGSDGVTIAQFRRSLNANLQELSFDLAQQRYHPWPLLRFPIPKRAGGQSMANDWELPAESEAERPKFRFLSVPTVRDRVAQSAVFLATRELFEAEFESVSHAYREGRGVHTAIEEILEWRKKGYRYAMDADIDSFFDNIDHGLLLEKLARLIPEPPLLRLFAKWIRAEVYDGRKIYPLQKGIPQGSVVSPHLANLFLDELDETLAGFGLKLVRYADDFLVLCKSPEEAEEAVELSDMILEDLKLDLNPLKTKVVSFDRGFKFLGAVFLSEGAYLPFPKKRAQGEPPRLPPALTLKRYLELRNWD